MTVKVRLPIDKYLDQDEKAFVDTDQGDWGNLSSSFGSLDLSVPLSCPVDTTGHYFSRVTMGPVVGRDVGVVPVISSVNILVISMETSAFWWVVWFSLDGKDCFTNKTL